MNYELQIKTGTGAVVSLPPHYMTGQPSIEQSKPDHKAPAEVHEGWKKMAKRVISFQQDILDRIEKWDLWKSFDEPGKMVEEYRRRRRAETDFKELVGIARRHVEDGGVSGTAIEPDNYVLPARAYKGHAINDDFMLDREIQAVFAFVIKNTNPNPYDDTPDGVDSMELKRRYDEMTIEVDIGATTGTVGAGRLTIGPGRCLPVPFAADPHINPRFDPSSGLAFERYEHWNPEHNRMLSAKRGTATLDAFQRPPVEEIKPDVKKKK